MLEALGEDKGTAALRHNAFNVLDNLSVPSGVVDERSVDRLYG